MLYSQSSTHHAWNSLQIEYTIKGAFSHLYIFVLYIHPVSEIVSCHFLSHHSFSDDNQLYKYGNVFQIPEIIHSNQSRVPDVKAWMTNNQLHLNNGKTEMTVFASKMTLNSDSVSESINLGVLTSNLPT